MNLLTVCSFLVILTSLGRILEPQTVEMYFIRLKLQLCAPDILLTADGTDLTNLFKDIKLREQQEPDLRQEELYKQSALSSAYGEHQPTFYFLAFHDHLFSILRRGFLYCTKMQNYLRSGIKTNRPIL